MSQRDSSTPVSANTPQPLEGTYLEPQASISQTVIPPRHPSFPLRSGDSHAVVREFIQSIGLQDRHFSLLVSEGISTAEDLQCLRSMRLETIDFLGSKLVEKGFTTMDYMKLRNALTNESSQAVSR